MSNASKSPGRTPPFVLVALVLVVVILGYNYWTMSSSNRTLRELNDKLTVETRDSTESRLIVEKNLEAAREELRILQENLEQAKKSSQEREEELSNVRSEQKKATDELAKCKESLAKCDADFNTEKTNVQKIADEKAKLETELQEAKNAPKPECGAEQCVSPIKDVLELFTKLVGTDAVSKTLKDGGLNENKLMEGLPKIEAPVKATPAQVEKAQ